MEATNGETRAARMRRIGDEIGYALGRGEFPENQLREFRFLWATTPDQEKEGLSLTLKSIEEMVARLREESALASQQLRYVPIEPVYPADYALGYR